MLNLAARFITLAAQIGYRGPINIDGIITDTNEIIFNEVNARWGGCSVLHYLGERLLGPQYANRHAVSSLREVECQPLPQLVERLREHGLAFDPETRRGAIALASDARASSIVEFVLMAPDFAQVRELERAIYHALEQSVPPEAPVVLPVSFGPPHAAQQVSP